MKTTLRSLSLSVALLSPLALVAGCSENHGSSHEVSHTESDKTGWFGGQTHAVDTVYRNSDGSTSVESETRTTNGNTTTIVRTRKTTGTDGSVKTDHETRTIVKGSDTVTSESKTVQ